MNRRSFLKSAGVSAAALNILPALTPGASGQAAPVEPLAVALIGCGTQGLRELPGLLATPGVRVVAVCDPNKDSDDYVDWSRDGLRKSLSGAIGVADWRAGQAIPAAAMSRRR